MTVPNQNIPPKEEMDIIYSSIINELDNEQLDRLEYLIKDRRLNLTLDKRGKTDRKATDFIDFICDKLNIRTIAKTKTDTRSANHWRCMINYLFNQMNLHEADIARLISRDRSLVCNQLKKYEELSNIYTDDAIKFKEQRKEFEQALRVYHNGSKVNKVKY